MIAAWFTRYGSPELQTFVDVDNLVDTLLMLDDADIAVFDQWGCFNFAEDGETGKVITYAELEASESRVKAERAAEAEVYVPPVYSHRIYLVDHKGRRHLWLRLRDGNALTELASKFSGLGDRVIVENI